MDNDDLYKSNILLYKDTLSQVVTLSCIERAVCRLFLKLYMLFVKTKTKSRSTKTQLVEYKFYTIRVVSDDDTMYFMEDLVTKHMHACWLL